MFCSKDKRRAQCSGRKAAGRKGVASAAVVGEELLLLIVTVDSPDPTSGGINAKKSSCKDFASS
jgi:hypothetical protein